MLTQQLRHLRARLRHPGQRLQELMQKLDGLELRLKRAQQQELRARSTQLRACWRVCAASTLRIALPALEQQVEGLEQRLARAMNLQLRERKTAMQHLAERAQLASPLAIVARGYAIVESEGRVLRSVSDAGIGNTLQARLADGRITATIIATEKN